MESRLALPSLLALIVTAASACETPPPPARPAPPARDAGSPRDVPPSRLDAGPPDVPAAPTEAAPRDAGPPPDVVDPRPIDELTLDDLRLIAVASSGTGPMVMVTTPSGHGVSLRRGDSVGRAERLPSGLDAGTSVRWRVARIAPSRLVREADGRLSEAPAAVTFTRPDPSRPGAQEERTLSLVPPAGGQGEGAIRMAGTPAPRDAGRAAR